MINFIYRFIPAAAIGLAIVFSSAYAASESTENAERSEKKAAERSDARKYKPLRKDLESCRRDAQNLHGPERARFMTKCLHERD